MRPAFYILFFLSGIPYATHCLQSPDRRVSCSFGLFLSRFLFLSLSHPFSNL